MTLTEWPDTWLHEGFATWSEWIWSEHKGNGSAHQTFEHYNNTPANQTWFWTPPPGDPGTPVFLFNGTITRGAMTLQALREKVGEMAFFQIMRRWAADGAAERDGSRQLLRRLALPAREAGHLVEASKERSPGAYGLSAGACTDRSENGPPGIRPIGEASLAR